LTSDIDAAPDAEEGGVAKEDAAEASNPLTLDEYDVVPGRTLLRYMGRCGALAKATLLILVVERAELEHVREDFAVLKTLDEGRQQHWLDVLKRLPTYEQRQIPDHEAAILPASSTPCGSAGPATMQLSLF